MPGEPRDDAAAREDAHAPVRAGGTRHGEPRRRPGRARCEPGDVDAGHVLDPPQWRAGAGPARAAAAQAADARADPRRFAALHRDPAEELADVLERLLGRP